MHMYFSWTWTPLVVTEMFTALPDWGRRGRHLESWVQNVAKIHNSSQACTNRACVMGPLCNDGCYNKTPSLMHDAMHEDFWALGDYVLQSSFIQKHTQKMPVKCCRKPHDTMQPDPVQFTLSYTSTSYSVCKQGFLNLALKKGRMNAVLKKMIQSDTLKDGIEDIILTASLTSTLSTSRTFATRTC